MQEGDDENFDIDKSKNRIKKDEVRKKNLFSLEKEGKDGEQQFLTLGSRSEFAETHIPSEHELQLELEPEFNHDTDLEANTFLPNHLSHNHQHPPFKAYPATVLFSAAKALSSSANTFFLEGDFPRASGIFISEFGLTSAKLLANDSKEESDSNIGLVLNPLGDIYKSVYATIFNFNKDLNYFLNKKEAKLESFIYQLLKASTIISSIFSYSISTIQLYDLINAIIDKATHHQSDTQSLDKNIAHDTFKLIILLPVMMIAYLSINSKLTYSWNKSKLNAKQWAKHIANFIHNPIESVKHLNRKTTVKALLVASVFILNALPDIASHRKGTNRLFEFIILNRLFSLLLYNLILYLSIANGVIATSVTKLGETFEIIDSFLQKKDSSNNNQLLTVADETSSQQSSAEDHIESLPDNNTDTPGNVCIYQFSNFMLMGLLLLNPFLNIPGNRKALSELLGINLVVAIYLLLFTKTLVDALYQKEANRKSAVHLSRANLPNICRKPNVAGLEVDADGDPIPSRIDEIPLTTSGNRIVSFLRSPLAMFSSSSPRTNTVNIFDGNEDENLNTDSNLSIHSL